MLSSLGNVGWPVIGHLQVVLEFFKIDDNIVLVADIVLDTAEILEVEGGNPLVDGGNWMFSLGGVLFGTEISCWVAVLKAAIRAELVLSSSASVAIIVFTPSSVFKAFLNLDFQLLPALLLFLELASSSSFVFRFSYAALRDAFKVLFPSAVRCHFISSSFFSWESLLNSDFGCHLKSTPVWPLPALKSIDAMLAFLDTL